MDLPETGNVTTPIDDPCQFNPAWRSIVSGYLFSVGVRTKKDLESISKTGCIEVTEQSSENPTNEEPRAKADMECDSQSNKGKTSLKRISKKKNKRKNQEDVRLKKTLVTVTPFDTNPEYRVFASDKWIEMHIEMFSDEIYGRQHSVEVSALNMASRWYYEMDHEAAIKKRIEALLLTEIGIDIIALDLTGMPSMQSAIEAYERLYFNCRDDNFNISPSMQLVQRFAMPYGTPKMFLRKYEEVDADGFVIGDGRPLAKESDVWRAIGATMGYEALIYYWRWDSRAHGIKDRSLAKMIELGWKASVSRLLSDLYTGDIKHEDAAKVLASFTSQLKFMEDKQNGSGHGGANDTTKALMNILYLAAPKMVQFDEAEDAARNDEIQSRIKSQLAINKQAIEDHGKQVEAEIVDAQISAAVEQ